MLTTDDIVEFCELERPTITRWVKDGIVVPAVSGRKGRGHSSLFSFQQGIALAMVAAIHQSKRSCSTKFVKELVLAIQKIPWGKLKKWFEPRSQTDRLRSAPSDNASWYHGLMLDKSEVRDIDRRLWRVFNEIKRRESEGMTSTGRSQNV